MVVVVSSKPGFSVVILSVVVKTGVSVVVISGFIVVVATGLSVAVMVGFRVVVISVVVGLVASVVVYDGSMVVISGLSVWPAQRSILAAWSQVWVASLQPVPLPHSKGYCDREPSSFLTHR